LYDAVNLNVSIAVVLNFKNASLTLKTKHSFFSFYYHKQIHILTIQCQLYEIDFSVRPIENLASK